MGERMDRGMKRCIAGGREVGKAGRRESRESPFQAVIPSFVYLVPRAVPLDP